MHRKGCYLSNERNQVADRRRAMSISAYLPTKVVYLNWRVILVVNLGVREMHCNQTRLSRAANKVF